ncbi:MAG: hypothetical protein LBV08_02125, partial [Clostridiales bacterium]|nr:hypothetical protein [Clostridiales bacterium]
SKDEPKNIVLKSTRDESNVSGGAELVNAETELGSDTIPLSAVDIDAGGGEIAPENTETLETTADSTTGDSYAAESKAESNPKTSDNSSTFKLVLLAVGTVYFVLFGILRYFKKDIKQI